MISRRTKIQLIAFVLLASLGIVYVGGKYAGLARLFTSTTYTVQLELADSGGIFTNAEVTYLGVTVGRVGDLEPTQDGVIVDLDIDKSAEKIPAEGVLAQVKNLSAIGEPYVDLVPMSTTSPYLDGDSVISVEQTSTPVAPAVLLSSLNGLLDSVPRDSLQTVLRELDAAFAGTGPELGQLLDNTSLLVDAAQDALPETITLIRDGAVALRAQNDESASITSFSRDLRLLSGQLKESDADIRRLIDTAPTLATQAVELLRESGPGLSQLVADLLTSGRLTGPRTNALRQLLITYPALARAAYSAVPGDGTVHFGLVLNVFDAPACTRGYEGTKRRTGTETMDIPPNTKATCAEKRGSPITVRGSQNAPRAGTPDAVRAPTTSRERAATPRRTSTATRPATPVQVTPAMLAQLAQLLEAPADLVTDPLEIVLRSLVPAG